MLLLAAGLSLGQDQVLPILHQTLRFGGDGQYQYKYHSDMDSRQEVKESKAQTPGSYSYSDENGAIYRAEYPAGRNSFQISATNLPRDTREVALIKQQHEAAVNHTRSIIPILSSEEVLPETLHLPISTRKQQTERILSEIVRTKAAYEQALRLQEELTLRQQEIPFQFPDVVEQKSSEFQLNVEAEQKAKPQITAEK